jgi:Leucine-rich repeat (LRR) protein
MKEVMRNGRRPWGWFLILVAVVGCQRCGATVSPELRDQAKAIQHLTNVRGERIAFEGIGSGKITAIIPFNMGPGNGWNDEQFLASIPSLQKIPELHTLRFINTKVTDVGLSGLAELPQVRELLFHVNQLSDAGLEPMQRMRNLERLICDNVLPLKRDGEWTDQKLTGVGFKFLQPLPRFTSLELIGTPLTDEGAEAISGLPHLERLTLIQANLITDAALESLSKMTHLKKLTIGGKQLTPDALAKLRQQLPSTEVVVLNN